MLYQAELLPDRGILGVIPAAEHHIKISLRNTAAALINRLGVFVDRDIDAFGVHRLNQLAGLIHFPNNITAAQKLAFDI